MRDRRGFAGVAMIALGYRPLWLALGVANLFAGVLVALLSTQSQDVRRVAMACRDWLVHGVNPYPGPEFTTNYPPYALVFLFPMAFVPLGLLKGMWAAGNAALAMITGWLGLKVTPFQQRSRHAALISVGFFLAWEGQRIGLELGQFTLVALASGLAAVAYRGTVGRGLLLALAMIKPQVGLAFVLWAILEGSVTAVLVAAVPIVLGTILFAARLGQSPLHVVALYGEVLRHEISGPDFRQGAVELRPLVYDLMGRTAIADAVNLGLIGGTLVLLLMAHRRMSVESRALFLLPLTCLWTLMSTYHPTYDLVLLWPVMVAISYWEVSERPKATIVAVLAAVQLALLVDIPGLVWKLNGRPIPPVQGGAVVTALQHFDRLLVLAVFAGLIRASIRWHTHAVRSRTLREAVPTPLGGAFENHQAVLSE